MSAGTPARRKPQAVNHTSSDDKDTRYYMIEEPLNGSRFHTQIYQHAAASPAKIYAAKDRYIHQKPPRHQGRQTKQHKKQLVQQCHKAWHAPHHRWEPHRSGFQWSARGERIHQALTVSIIEDKQLSVAPHLWSKSSEDRLRRPVSPNLKITTSRP